MKKIIAFISILTLTATTVFSQKVTGQLKFDQGQTLSVSVRIKTSISRQAMGQAIDFMADGSASHLYKVTNATNDNTTLHHQVQQIGFNFDGMGQKRSFDSNNEKDMNGQFGKPVKEMLGKTYDMIIDPNGKVLIVLPEKTDTTKMDQRMAIITNMLKGVLEIVLPPQKGADSFFKVLPENEKGIGDTWNESKENKTGKINTVYTLSAITDSTIEVDFKETSVTVSKAEMMGSETATTMNNSTTGKYILDKATGILREKTYTTESNGSTEIMGTTLPITSRATTTITVK